MGIIFKVILAITALVSMSLSSLGFRSDNFLVGIIFVIIAIIALIFLMKFLWELIGCALTIGLIIGFIALVLYVSGAFTDGSGLIPDKALSYIQGNKEPPPNQTLYGQAQSLTGDMFKMGSKMFYLFGIAAPRLDQTCKSNIGSNYNCGGSAKMFLQEKISGKEPVCTILSTAPAKGKALPVICNIGEYDLGALMVAGGWAIPDVSGGMVYVPYEGEAKKRKIGMWQGSFSSPWEWDRLKQDQQQRMKTIKVPEPKKEPSALMKSFWN